MLPTLAAAAALSVLPGFHSPTGNIRCYLGPPGILRCEIAEADYVQALEDHCINGRGVDWHGWELRRTGAARVTCSGGILYPGSDKPVYRNLPYGATWRKAAFACVSAVTGLTCRNQDGHTLFLSRRAWHAS